MSVYTCLLLGFASRLVDWVLVLFGLPSVLLLILLGRLKKIKTLVSTVDGKTTEATRWSCWCVITTK